MTRQQQQPRGQGWVHTGTSSTHAAAQFSGCGTTQGFTSQMSLAYSAMVRSVLNLPAPAVIMMLMRAHLALSWYVLSTLSCSRTAAQTAGQQRCQHQGTRSCGARPSLQDQLPQRRKHAGTASTQQALAHPARHHCSSSECAPVRPGSLGSRLPPGSSRHLQHDTHDDTKPSDTADRCATIASPAAHTLPLTMVSSLSAQHAGQMKQTQTQNQHPHKRAQHTTSSLCLPPTCTLTHTHARAHLS